MLAETTVRRMGSSQGVIIPREMCDAVGFHVGMRVVLTLEEGCGASGCVVMEQVRAIDLDARPTKLLGRLEGELLDDILACVSSFFAPSLERTY